MGWVSVLQYELVSVWMWAQVRVSVLAWRLAWRLAPVLAWRLASVLVITATFR